LGVLLDTATVIDTFGNALVNANPWLLAGTGMLLGMAIVFIYSRRLMGQRRSESFELGLQQNASVQADEQRMLQDRIQLMEDKLNQAQQQHAADRASLASLEKQLHDTRHDLESRREQMAAALTQAAATSARLDEAQKSFVEKEALFKETSVQLKQEFEFLANRVFEAQGAKHQTSLQNVLSPFKEQMVDFKKRVEEVYHTDTKERATLLSEIKNLQSASERINTEAENLTKALKGDKKIQGNWGELVLERVLEDSGLRKDHEYFVQTSKRNEEGDIKRPDVLIQLPDNKDVVVDSKMSLNAYEEALSTEDDDHREQMLRQHLANLRNHVKRLSEQDYDQLPDVRSLDFVLLFIPIESAFTLAMELDHKLFTEAFTKRIVIVSPTTLMMTLRIINNVWRYEKQNKNSLEIAQRAGALYDKLRVLVDEMDSLGKQLTTVERTYSSVYSKLATGKSNLVRQVEKFRELGAQVKKPMPAKLIDKAVEEE
jgi:DNA recombination protein RmuC